MDQENGEKQLRGFLLLCRCRLRYLYFVDAVLGKVI